MKRFLVIISVIFISMGIYAQPPGGGERGRGGRPPGDRMGQRPSFSNEDKPILEHFPEIPDLTLQQREKVGTILTNERKDINKQMEKRRDIDKKRNPKVTEKELDKQRKEIDKIDKKIQDIKSKSDKKIKKVLSDDQYLVFIEKREEFKFKQRQQRPPRNKERRMDENHSPPPFPGKHENFE